MQEEPTPCTLWFSISSANWLEYAWHYNSCINTLQYENTWALTALPRRALLVSVLAQRRQMAPWCHIVKSWCHVVTSHGVIGHDKMDLCNLHKSHNQKVRKSCFWKWLPWPLTYDLRTCLTYYKRQSSHRILFSYPKRFSRESGDRWTDRQTDRTDFIPPTADVGGNKYKAHSLGKHHLLEPNGLQLCNYKRKKYIDSFNAKLTDRGFYLSVTYRLISNCLRLYTFLYIFLSDKSHITV